MRAHTIWLFLVGFLPVCGGSAAVPQREPAGTGEVPVVAPTPRLFLSDAADLLAARAGLARGDPRLRPALDRLLAEAGQALTMRPPSVMDKTIIPASGDRHDYFSYGPYWWPDPAKPNGLPYIRRDGERNPAANEGTDDSAFTQVCEAVETLGLAYWYTHDERYAAKAAALVRVWFLEPATRMNPNFQHAQAIPGVADGRGIGIIESRTLMRLNEGLALLDDSPAWTRADRAALVDWLSAFYDWLRTSANGRAERAELNNHGTWYDAQVAHLALVLGRPVDARAILTEGLTRRLAAQVEPDGSQPRELARTKSLHYSIFNLEALIDCAQLAEQVGVDWWRYATSDGRSLRAALAYVAPYADPAKAWPRPDLPGEGRSELIPLLARFLRHREDMPLREIYETFYSGLPADSRRLLMDNLPRPSRPAGPAGVKPPLKKEKEVTPLSLAGSEPHVFRQLGEIELRLHVVKPAGWSRGDRRPCLVSFFGGGWSSGTPQTSVTWAAWAATLGLVGVAPDYRTRDRLGGTPEDCVADGRAAVRWIVAHADELGVDPQKIVAFGGSAGGHIAAWTAIPALGPGKDDPAPEVLPVALILLNPVTDTKAGGYGGPKRFGGDAARALACSVPDQMPTRMPPALIFHATGDTTVPYATTQAFRDKLIRHGNRCDLVTFEGLGHSFHSSKYGELGKAARETVKKEGAAFLASLGLLADQGSVQK